MISRTETATERPFAYRVQSSSNLKIERLFMKMRLIFSDQEIEEVKRRFVTESDAEIIEVVLSLIDQNSAFSEDGAAFLEEMGIDFQEIQQHKLQIEQKAAEQINYVMQQGMTRGKNLLHQAAACEAKIKQTLQEHRERGLELKQSVDQMSEEMMELVEEAHELALHANETVTGHLQSIDRDLSDLIGKMEDL